MLRLAEQLEADPSLLTPPLRNVPGATLPAPMNYPVHSQIGMAHAPGPYETDKVDQGYMPAYNEIADRLGFAARVCELGVRGAGHSPHGRACSLTGQSPGWT